VIVPIALAILIIALRSGGA